MKTLIRFVVGVGLLAFLLNQVPAQDKQPPKKPGPPSKDDYREYFKTPETLEDFWTALHLELDVGRFELAAKLLRGLIERKPSDEDLMKLEEKEGTSSFLRLRTVRKWSSDPKADEQARKDVGELTDRLAQAMEKVLGDPNRIGKYLKNLLGDPEERQFARRELARAGAAAVPQMLATLQGGSADEREAVQTLLPQLPADTLPPLVAALDTPDDSLKLDILGVIQARAAQAKQSGDIAALVAIAPQLWNTAGSAKVPDRVRARALDVLAQLLGRPASSLPAPQAALTREAERYYKHEITWPNPDKVTVWRWDDKALVKGWPGSPTVSASRAEEYYGLRYARQALAIDPTYGPAQQAFLSIALDKGVERAGPDKPLARAAPDVQQLLATVNSDLLLQVLEKALAENRLPVILGATRALGDLADPRALRPATRAEPGLVQALNYPDRRVNMAAAEAILRMPVTPSPAVAGRVVDVLRRAAAMEPVGKDRQVLVGFSSDAVTSAVIRAIEAVKVGDVRYHAVPVRTGREALLRLEAAADIDAILVDTTLPDPGFASLLAQLRARTGYGALPLWLVLPGETLESLTRRRTEAEERLRALAVESRALVEARAEADLKRAHTRDVAVEAEMRDRLGGIESKLTGLTPRRKQELESARAELLPQEKRLRGSELLALQAKLAAIQEELTLVSVQEQEQLTRAELERIRRELLSALPCRATSVGRLAERYTNCWLIEESTALDPRELTRLLARQGGEGAAKPLSEAEKKDQAERAIVWLARIATGELTGYDVQPAEDAIYRALVTPGLSETAQRAAIIAAGRLPGSRPQTELSSITLDPKRTAAIRTAAATELVQAIQRASPALSGTQRQALEALRADEKTDAGLRAAVAVVIGSTRPDARLTGERLQKFDPRPAAPVPPKKDP